jgi:hypothetical protein
MTKYGPRPTPYPVRFWAKVEKGDGCWEWKAAKRNGYGVFTLTGPKKMVLAHRLSYQMAYRYIPDGLLICHHCDNPGCVRPSHLYVGTKKDNARDAAERGQLAGRRVGDQRGERNHRARLDWQSVNRIRRDWQTGNYTASQLGDKYEVSRSAAWAAATGRTWFGKDE